MQKARELKELFEKHLLAESFQKEPKNLYTPIHYILQLKGKRFRPVLVLMAYEIFAPNVSAALNIAMSIEIFHNFTLVHDDIMDKAELRRGQKSLHQKFGLDAGILSGDLMSIYAYHYLINGSHQNHLDVLKVFNSTSIAICEGQQLDMDFEKRSEVSISEYIEMIEKKTAVLIGASMQMGALAAGASSRDAYHLYQYGKNLGIAFQIQDDVLDVFGEPDRFGKILGGDIIQGKKTYLYLKAVELLSPSERSKFNELYASKTIPADKKVPKVKEIFEALNVLEYARQTQDAYAKLSDSHIENVHVPDQQKEMLKSFSRELFDRQT